MISKILRADGTEIASIKSVVYTETVNAGDGLRPGCVASASINVELFGSQSSAPSSGEALTYYQVDASGNETLIGVFYAEPSIPTRNTIKFIAYDAVAKLDKVFSERLNAIQSNFPMTIYDIVFEACSYAGVTLGSDSWPLSTQTVEAFYADGLTCRNILQYAAELAGRFVRCDSSGAVIFDWYATGVMKDVLTTESSVEITSESEEEIDVDVHSGNGLYRIYPSSGTDSGMTLIAYKQDGLLYDNFTVVPVDVVAIQPTGTENVVYTYPTGADVSSATNPFVISDNLLLTSASQSVYVASAKNIYDVMTALPTYRHATINLFTGENPFRAGEFVYVTDSQGVSFIAPVFEMVVQASAAQLRSSGNAKYEGSGTSTSKALANLSANVIKFTNDVVFTSDLTDGETVISGDNITTGTIRAQSGDSYWNLDTGDMYIAGAVSESDLSTGGGTTINGANITTGTIDASKATITNIDADNITTGALTVEDSNGDILFKADKDSNEVQIAGFTASADNLSSDKLEINGSEIKCTGDNTTEGFEQSAYLTDANLVWYANDSLGSGARGQIGLSKGASASLVDETDGWFHINSVYRGDGIMFGYDGGTLEKWFTMDSYGLNAYNPIYLYSGSNYVPINYAYARSWYNLTYNGTSSPGPDTTPTSGSTRAVTSGGVYSALSNKLTLNSSLTYTAWSSTYTFRDDGSTTQITLPCATLKSGTLSGSTINWTFAPIGGTAFYASATPTSITRVNADVAVVSFSTPSSMPSGGAYGICVPRGNFVLTSS